MGNNCGYENLPNTECVIGNVCFRATLDILLYVCALQHVLMIRKLSVEVRGRLAGVGSLSPSHGYWESTKAVRRGSSALTP